jgi:hypothetical protein
MAALLLLSPLTSTVRSTTAGGGREEQLGSAPRALRSPGGGLAHMRGGHGREEDDADDPEAAAVWKAAKALSPSELCVEVPTPHGIWLMSRVPRPQAGSRESDLYVATPEIAAAKEGTKMWNHSSIRAFGSLHEVLRMRFEARPDACKCSPQRPPLPHRCCECASRRATRGERFGARPLSTS